ncbi:hypothetical protein CDV36_010310 [Fusarium kuroshium]|uniref:CHAT domain-containing protein n=1 Tax=Fusarium kuroshium TaxID=2010991 RepID=A0A3M2RXN7_9HYPO|nr:hypothetical protein CDV36_010310 [Fusarium kuroshium]
MLPAYRSWPISREVIQGHTTPDSGQQRPNNDNAFVRQYEIEGSAGDSSAKVYQPQNTAHSEARVTDDHLEGDYSHPLGDNIDDRIAKANIQASFGPASQHIHWALVAGELLYARYYWHGAIEDLNMAIDLAPRATIEEPGPIDVENENPVSTFIQLSTTQHSSASPLPPNRGFSTRSGYGTEIETVLRCHNNLGCYLGQRYLRLGNTSDIDEAIRISRFAVNITPENHPRLAGRMNNLAVLLGHKHAHQRTLLDDAVSCAEKACLLTPAADPARAIRLNNFATLVAEKNSFSNAASGHVDEISWMQDAVRSASLQSSHMATLHYNLGLLYHARFGHLRSELDLNAAQDHLFAALRSEKSTGSVRIRAGRAFLSLPGILQDTERAISAAQTSTNLVAESVSHSLRSTDKHYILSQAVGISSDSASVALHLDQDDAYSALQLLETGRAVLTSTIQNLRVDPSSLKDCDPSVADHYIKSRARLDAQDANDPFKPVPSAVLNMQVAYDGQIARRDRERGLSLAIQQVRDQPSFETFLHPLSEIEMLNAARDGPIAVINVSSHRCDALIIQMTGTSTIHLPGLTLSDVQFRSGNTHCVDALLWLWQTTVRPVLDYLGFLAPPYADQSWPHIWWISTGPLAGFPLHAAGDHLGRNSHTALDRVISSYSLSIGSIIRTRQRPSLGTATRVCQDAVLVAEPEPLGQDYLPHASDEVDVVREACQSVGLSCFQSPNGKGSLLKQLESCRIFHFAGHGGADRDNALESHLLGTELTVARLLDANLSSRPPFLAYLSACGTSQIQDKRATDESIHIAAAFQLAGFRHVIGTLWDVNDKLCVDMAQRFYTSLGKEGLEDGSVSRALHFAVRDLRDEWVRGEEDAGRGVACVRGRIKLGVHAKRAKALWVPYIHFGV